MSLLVHALRWGNNKLRDARSIRKVAIAAYAEAVRLNAFLPPPRVLLNGPPKSGTHLAADCLSLLPKMMFSGRHFALAEFVVPPSAPEDAQYGTRPPPSVDAGALDRFLRRCPDGMFATAHARFHPVLQDVLRRHAFRHVVVMRDPRDLAVSLSFFVAKERWHRHHRRFVELGSPEARLMATIRGLPAGAPGERPLAPVAEVVSGHLAWPEGETLVLRFEDLVGPRGGSDEATQLATVRRLASYVGRELDEAAAREVASRMHSSKSFTFRKGVAGDWRSQFTDEHRQAFKETARDLLVRMGYERDDAW